MGNRRATFSELNTATSVLPHHLEVVTPSDETNAIGQAELGRELLEPAVRLRRRPAGAGPQAPVPEAGTRINVDRS